MAERESAARTIMVAGGVAIVCSLLVSSAVHWLRPYQAAHRSIEQNRSILLAAGLIHGDEEIADREIVARYLELDVRVADLGAGRYADEVDAATYDYRTAADDPALSTAIPSDRDTAGIGRRPRYMPVYLLRRENVLERLVLPVYGRGMWSTIYAFVSLGPELTDVTGVAFFEHGETPGIGDRIEDPAWTRQWAGKRLFDAEGRVSLRIGGSGAAPESTVDAITGATVTVSSVDRLVRFWFGPDGYAPFLAAIREGRTQ